MSTVWKKLTAENVEELFHDCLFKTKEELDNGNGIHVEGLVLTATFNPEQIKYYEVMIFELLHQLPEQFLSIQSGGGGGWTFLNMNADKQLNVWGEQSHAQQLLMLGIAAGYARFCVEDRRKWPLMPGNVPYVEVSTFKYKSVVAPTVIETPADVFNEQEVPNGSSV